MTDRHVLLVGPLGRAMARVSAVPAAVRTLVVSGVDCELKARDLLAAAHQLGFAELSGLVVRQLVFIDGGDVDRLSAELFGDPLLNSVHNERSEHPMVVESALIPGVTDPLAAAITTAAELIGSPITAVATGWRYELTGTLSHERLEALVRRVLVNAVIERWSLGPIDAAFPTDPGGADHVETVTIRGLDAEALATLDKARGLTFDPAEIAAVQAWFTAEGRDPTDAELETLAQTWSEHCAHTTFRAAITTESGTAVEPLIGQLRAATDLIAAPWVVSAFVGNAGIVDLGPGLTVAVKVETHNHPSAIEPFGGANTGVGGVLRDVLAAPARPIAALDVLCFGPLDLDPDQVPDGSLHPQRIADGVIAGVADYGNKLGVPTVAGAIVHAPGYTANPLVFCGCVGLVPDHQPLDGPHPGDRVIVIGGGTGRDGIKGATFSSAGMDATTGEVAGASVQIGDPIVEKLVADVLDEAIVCCSALTDCGAGGLSSAVGELADPVGATVELTTVPLKYPGLAPWEVWLSEAQERMVLAVPPAKVAELAEICRRHQVDWADIGSFTGDGRLQVLHKGVPVVDLPTEFLHHGRPQRRLDAVMPSPDRSLVPSPEVGDPTATLLALLAHPTISSKESVIRRYDHEVRGATVVRPLTGLDGPSDGVVISPPPLTGGVAIGLGLNPWVGELDPERMGHLVVDEAIRNVVVAGGDPDRIALLDNFSWGDPRDPATLGALVATVEACCAASLAHGAPFVSGKDSLNNCYVDSAGNRHGVPPTLVITAVAAVPAIEHVPTSDLAAPGDVLVLVGETGPELGGAHLHHVLDLGAQGAVPPPDAGAPARYRSFHRAVLEGLVVSAHDVSEGGVAVALAEMAIGGGLGFDAVVSGPSATALFGESGGRIIAAVHPGALDAFRAHFDGPTEVLGSVRDDDLVVISAEASLIRVTVGELAAAWRSGPHGPAPVTT